MIKGRVTVDIPKDAPGELLKRLDEALDDLADFIFMRSQELVPVDESTLARSGDVERSFLEKKIIYNAPHAPYVEFGTEPHMPPVKPLIEWARRHKFKNPEKAGWAIAMKIKKHGTRPQPFLRPALDQGRARAKDIIKRRFK